MQFVFQQRTYAKKIYNYSITVFKNCKSHSRGKSSSDLIYKYHYKGIQSRDKGVAMQKAAALGEFETRNRS